ncbi:MAG: DUF6250 domain-containing protein [Syntrophothermus sp.]
MKNNQTYIKMGFKGAVSIYSLSRFFSSIILQKNTVLIFLICFGSTAAQTEHLRSLLKDYGSEDKMKLIISDDFTGSDSLWIKEFEKPEDSEMRIMHGRMEIKTSRGATVWLKQKLSGNIMITYDAMVIQDSCSYDRVSDLNCFWMAEDSVKEILPSRDGKFTSYDDMKLYYAGIGGNNNTTTRFRKYEGNGNKPLIGEFLNEDHLLKGQMNYKIKIIVDSGGVLFIVNNQVYFEYSDIKQFSKGYFAFRTTRSHQQIKRFRVYEIIK